LTKGSSMILTRIDLGSIWVFSNTENAIVNSSYWIYYLVEWVNTSMSWDVSLTCDMNCEFPFA
jgi:hypothetical protein